MPFVPVKPQPMFVQLTRLVDASRPKPVFVCVEVRRRLNVPATRLDLVNAGAGGGAGNAIE